MYINLNKLNIFTQTKSQKMSVVGFDIGNYKIS